MDNDMVASVVEAAQKNQGTQLDILRRVLDNAFTDVVSEVAITSVKDLDVSPDKKLEDIKDIAEKSLQTRLETFASIERIIRMTTQGY